MKKFAAICLSVFLTSCSFITGKVLPDYSAMDKVKEVTEQYFKAKENLDPKTIEYAAQAIKYSQDLYETADEESAVKVQAYIVSSLVSIDMGDYSKVRIPVFKQYLKSVGSNTWLASLGNTVLGTSVCNEGNVEDAESYFSVAEKSKFENIDYKLNAYSNHINCITSKVDDEPVLTEKLVSIKNDLIDIEKQFPKNASATLIVAEASSLVGDSLLACTKAEQAIKAGTLSKMKTNAANFIIKTDCEDAD